MRFASSIGNGLLTVLAALGVLCIAAVVAAHFFPVTLIMFSTGSMSPTIPTGSVALVREIPAAQIRVGDVVTVDRQGALPITHRVTGIEPASAGSPTDTRVITMRGDANAQDDLDPYTVSTVRIVEGSVPGLATVIVGASHPLVMGGITVAAALLVTWAFWPRAAAGRHRDEKTAVPAPVGLAGLLSVAALAFVAGAPATPAHATSDNAASANAGSDDTVITGDYLTLTSGPPGSLNSLTAGTAAGWQVGIEATPPSRGVIAVGITATGKLAHEGGARVEVRGCQVRWVDDSCAAGEELWADWHALSDLRTTGAPVHLVTIDANDTVWVMTRVALPTGASRGDTAQIRIHADANGDGPGDDPGDGGGDNDASAGATAGGLAATGITPLWWMPTTAVLAGLVIAGAARLRRNAIDRRAGESG
ncbi:MAG: signal peptidase I [Burkholderiaceae bacterium]|nr:signal peptidase I [Microbacteriaceae bacterium]